MPRTKRDGYDDKQFSFKIPSELAKKIDEYVKENPGLGIKNRTDFIVYILRNATKDIRKETSQQDSEIPR